MKIIRISILVLILVLVLQTYAAVILRREENKKDYQAQLYADAPGRYFLHAQRKDISNTRSVGVGFCVYYLDSNGSERNKSFYVSDGDREQKWEFHVREDIFVYSIEALNLTDSGHHWRVWIALELK